MAWFVLRYSYRRDFVLKKLLRRNIVRDTLVIILGCAIYAVGLDCFEVPNGIAAGGVTGLAQVIQSVAAHHGVRLPIGLQVLAMNAVLLIPVYKTGGLRYAARTVVGVVASSLLTDALYPIVPTLGGGDLLLSTLWGGVVVGVGLGIIFRQGGNTGGTDILAQILAKHTPISQGNAILIVDTLVVAASIPVFGLRNALYAVVAMYLTSYVIDRVVDGGNARRMAYIITEHRERMKEVILEDLDRGCTELMARGAYTDRERPVLMVVVSRNETGMLKKLVEAVDPDAIVFISEVYEAFGEGFSSLRQP